MKIKIIILFFGFFIATPFLIIYLFCFFDNPLKDSQNNFSFPNSHYVLGDWTTVPQNSTRIFASLPQNPAVVYSTILQRKSAPIIIERYLKHYNSPLTGFVEKIISSAEKNNVDPFLIVAIAQQESNLGKKSLEGCYNAWGWGIHSKGTKCYESWEEAIESVADGIGKDYCQKGYCDDPCIMMKKYTPRSNGSWCNGVKQFLGEMESGNY